MSSLLSVPNKKETPFFLGSYQKNENIGPLSEVIKISSEICLSFTRKKIYNENLVIKSH